MLRLTDYEWWKDPKWLPQPQEDANGVLGGWRGHPRSAHRHG